MFKRILFCFSDCSPGSGTSNFKKLHVRVPSCADEPSVSTIFGSDCLLTFFSVPYIAFSWFFRCFRNMFITNVQKYVIKNFVARDITFSGEVFFAVRAKCLPICSSKIPLLWERGFRRDRNLDSNREMVGSMLVV